MRELNISEIKEVNGGIRAFFLGWIGGHALDSVIGNWRGRSSYREFNDYRLAP